MFTIVSYSKNHYLEGQELIGHRSNSFYFQDYKNANRKYAELLKEVMNAEVENRRVSFRVVAGDNRQMNFVINEDDGAYTSVKVRLDLAEFSDDIDDEDMIDIND